MILVVALGLIAMIVTVWRSHTPGGISLDALPGNVGVPLRWWNDTWTFSTSPATRRWTQAQALLLLAFLVASIVVLGWLKGILLVVVSQVLAAVIGGMSRDREPQIGPALQRVAAQARENAHRYRGAGDFERAAGAEGLAVRIDAFRAVYAHLSHQEFVEFTPPGETANLLQSFFLSDEIMDDADLDLPRWLATGVRSFSTHPREQARVALLERVRLELIAGGGTRFADRERIRELVAELRGPAT